MVVSVDTMRAEVPGPRWRRRPHRHDVSGGLADPEMPRWWPRPA
ncbi:Dihydropteroate synthase [[Actinomadura] parvosata subsp. kistnae]|nr:Dihydropteroate synthase [Actinomadura parvosata subsp. kistnae]